MENQLVPYQASTLPDCAQVLVLAPHPDDEVFGAGGLCALLNQAGKTVHVHVISDGALGGEATSASELVALREAESRRAAQLLGLPEPHFWRLPDRSLAYGEFLVTKVEQLLLELNVDLLVCPALTEMHPDHRALAMVALEAVRRVGRGIRVWMYEVGVPVPYPDVLIDISSVQMLKEAAMAAFTSQLAAQDYAGQIQALNRYRTYTLGAGVKAVEAFKSWSPSPSGLDFWALYEPEYLRQRRMGLPLDSESDLPLVSIMIRSMARDRLQRALDAIALQTYPNIEVVVVNAIGDGHPALSDTCGRYPMRLVGKRAESGAWLSLRRAAAANCALDHAQGLWLQFLDDDDWIAPNHVERLWQRLKNEPGCSAAHAGVACLFPDGSDAGVRFDQPVDLVTLTAGNQLPIHSVLFAHSLLAAGCRFDESLDLYEDWDFWLQVGQKTRFCHVPGVSAWYLLVGNSGVHDVKTAHDAAQASILHKWHERWQEGHLENIMSWIRQAQGELLQLPVLAKQLEASRENELFLQRALSEAVQASERSAGELARSITERQLHQAEIQTLQGRVASLQSEICAVKDHAEMESLYYQRQVQEKEAALAALYASRSWRALSWVRKLVGFFRR